MALGLARELAKKLARLFLGEYSLYRIYSSPSNERGEEPSEAANKSFRVEPVDERTLDASEDALIRDQAGYCGPGARAYACFDGDRIVGVCFYWFGDRYLKRNFWPLESSEAKLVQIISLPEMRGRGVATTLIKGSCQAMISNGFRRAYARIWHSNQPSLMAFERARWERVASVLEINPLRLNRPIRIRWRV